MNFSSVVEQSTNKLWACHFEVPPALAAQLMADGNQRVICTLGNQTWQCALQPYAKGRRVIMVNKKLKELLGLHYGDTIEAHLEKDESEYGLPVPEEFAALLDQDPDGNRLFHALTDGKKRTLLYILAKPKSSDLRIRTALAVVNHLKINKGKIDYKQLGEELKVAAR